MSDRIERLANIGIVAVCALLFAFIVIRLVQGNRGTDRSRDYAVGERIESVPGLSTGNSDKTLIVALRSSCPYCSASMDFYRRIARARTGQFRMVALVPEPLENAKNYLAGQNIQFDQVVSFLPGSLRIRAVPTLLLVGRGGDILHKSWNGLLRPTQEQEVLDALAR
jgi:hypothetical protein